MPASDKRDRVMEIYHRNVDTVYRISMLYLKNTQDAEDNVQATFTRLMETGKSFENDRHEQAWLVVTASNLCKNQLSNWYRKRRSDTDFEAFGAGWEPEDRSLLLEVLALPPKYKTVVYLHYYEGYTTQEISRYLHINESTLRSQLVKGRKLLREALGEDRNG